MAMNIIAFLLFLLLVAIVWIAIDEDETGSKG